MTNFSDVPYEVKFNAIKDNFLSFDRVVNPKEINALALASKENLRTIETIAGDILNQYEAANLIKDRALEINPYFPNRVNLARIHSQFLKKAIEETTNKEDLDLKITTPFANIIQNTSHLSPAHVLKLHEVLKERQQEGNKDLFLLWDVLTFGKKRCHFGLFEFNFRQLHVPSAHLFTKEEIAVWLKDPKNTEQIAKVKKLDLSHLELKQLPPEIGHLTALKELNLAENRLTHLPKEIRKLVSLEKLCLDGNQLSEFPSVVGQLESLKELKLRRNRLAELPPVIRLLKQLTHLVLSTNRLTSLPLEIGGLNHLKVLSVDGNQLTSLPHSVGQLASLTHLNLCDNRLRELPITAGQLHNLTHLDFSFSQLETLPESIRYLRSLTHLTLTKNQLTSLPEGIKFLPLLDLDLSLNAFEQFPSELIDSHVLKRGRIDFEANPCKELPVEVVPYLDHILYSRVPLKATLLYFFSLVRRVFRWRA